MVIKKDDQNTNRLISAVKKRTIQTVIAKEVVFLTEIELLKSDRNFTEFFRFFEYMKEQGTSIWWHIKKADDMYELYSVMRFFEKQIQSWESKNLEVKFNNGNNKLILTVDWEILQHQIAYDDVSWQIWHRTDYVSLKKKLVFESKNYANIDSVSKFIRDVYCYCLFCDKKYWPKYNWILLIRNKPKNINDLENIRILSNKNITIYKIS